MIIQLVRQQHKFLTYFALTFYYFRIKETGQKVSPPIPMITCPKKLWGRTFIESYKTKQIMELEESTKILIEYEI